MPVKQLAPVSAMTTMRIAVAVVAAAHEHGARCVVHRRRIIGAGRIVHRRGGRVVNRGGIVDRGRRGVIRCRKRNADGHTDRDTARVGCRDAACCKQCKTGGC